MLARPILIGVLGAIVIVVAFALNYYLSVNEEVDHAARQDTGANKPVVKSSKKAGAPAAPRTAAKGTPSKPTATAQSPAAGTTTSKPVLNSQNPVLAVAPVQPSFDILRVDPEGNTVIAGRASAHSSIEILDGETVIGKATADARGEWIFVPEAKLEPGKRVLALRSTDKQGETAASDTAVIVVIPEPGKDIAGKKSDQPSTPLAMAVPRGDAAASKPSVILQAPTATEPKPATAANASAASAAKDDKKTQTAMAAPATTTPAAAPTTTTKAVTPPAVAGSTTTASTTKTSGATAPAAAAATTVDPAKTASVTAAPVAAAPTTTAPATAAPATTAPATKTPATKTPATTAPSTTAPVAVAAAPATVPAAPASGAPAKAEAEGKPKEEIALKTVDYDDKGKVVFGGVSEPGSQVQVYVNNKLAGKTKTDSDGTWAVKPEANVAPGTHTVRIDKVETSGRVLARVELPFMRSEPLRDLPPGAVVVVQPGNSLWRIASRIYGSGVRYTDIYQANLGQIGDPDMIYPGQVFGLPKVN